MNSVKFFKHKEKVDYSKLKLISSLSFLIGFSGALLAYVISVYLKDILKTDNLGAVYLIAYGIVLVALLNLHKLIAVSGKSFVFQLTFILKIVALLGLIAFPYSIWGVVFFVFYTITSALSWASLDAITESFSEDKKSGRIRGMYLTVMNAGILIGPLISSRILEHFGFMGIFLTAMMINILIFIAASLNIRGTNHKFKKKERIMELLKKVSERKNVIKDYYISFAMEFFYALMIIYVPIYLLEKGFSWNELGIAFTIMLLPFIILQYPAGVLADRKIGEKEMIALSFFVTGISVLMFYFSDSTELAIWTLILFLGRAGISIVEVLRESYFYKRIDGNSVDLINFFKTSKSVAYIAAAVLSGIVIYFFSVKEVFLLAAIVVFSAIYPAVKMKDNLGEEEQTF